MAGVIPFGPQKIELDLKRFMLWVDSAIRNYAAHGMVISCIILPAMQETPIYNRLLVAPLPKDDELRIDKVGRGLVLKLLARNIPIKFAPHLKEALFRIKEVNSK
jgi:hypothetical protein